MKKTTYYKGLDENLCGCNNYQYEVGKEYTADTDDTWYWLHFAKKMKSAAKFGCRIVEVEPVTQIMRYGSFDDMNAKTIRIVRELSHEEIIAKLMEEKCPVYMMERFKPTYDKLVKYRGRIKRCDYRAICSYFNWLTPEEKIDLLPKSWERSVRMREKLGREKEEGR